MDEDSRGYLTKAKESLAGAELEFNAGYYNNCANRCYYAAFQAAVYALARAGVKPDSRKGTWSHAALQADFAGILITRRKLYPAALGDHLTLTRSVRAAADYDSETISETQAYRALRRAREFLAAIQATR